MDDQTPGNAIHTEGDAETESVESPEMMIVLILDKILWIG